MQLRIVVSKTTAAIKLYRNLEGYVTLQTQLRLQLHCKLSLQSKGNLSMTIC